MKKNNILWITRELDDRLKIHFEEPFYHGAFYGWRTEEDESRGDDAIELPKQIEWIVDFDKVTFENSPRQIQLTVIN